MTVQVSIAVPTSTEHQRLRLRQFEATSGEPLAEEILVAGERSTLFVWPGAHLVLEAIAPAEIQAAAPALVLAIEPVAERPAHLELAERVDAVPA